MYGAGILREVSGQERDEGLQSYNYEEREASDSGNVSRVRHKDVQNREKLRIINIRILQKVGYLQLRCPAFLLFVISV